MVGTPSASTVSLGRLLAVLTALVVVAAAASAAPAAAYAYAAPVVNARKVAPAVLDGGFVFPGMSAFKHAQHRCGALPTAPVAIRPLFCRAA